MSSERLVPGNAAVEEVPPEGAAPRRRTPTYMEAVRAPVVEPVPDTRNDKSGPARTRIGLPPVTMLPAQARGIGRGGGTRGQWSNHRVEQRQPQRRPDAAQDRPARQRSPGDDHGVFLMRKGALFTIPTMSDENR